MVRWRAARTTPTLWWSCCSDRGSQSSNSPIPSKWFSWFLWLLRWKSRVSTFNTFHPQISSSITCDLCPYRADGLFETTWNIQLKTSQPEKKMWRVSEFKLRPSFYKSISTPTTSLAISSGKRLIEPMRTLASMPHGTEAAKLTSQMKLITRTARDSFDLVCNRIEWQMAMYRSVVNAMMVRIEA